MERLKQAMERARAERQRLNQPPPLQVSSREPPVPIPSREPSKAPPGKTEVAGVHEDAADAYKILRTQILHRMRAKSLRTLAITSPGIGDGKTRTAINLAIRLARDVNQSVLLVDFDLKHPAIGRYFMSRDALGLIEYLNGDVELSDVLINPGIERLVILPGGKRIRHSSELISSPCVGPLVEELKRHDEDRLILFDMPPLFAGDDVIAFLPYVDAVMLVVADGKVSREQLAHASELLGDTCIGMVLNKAESGSAPPGYGY